MRYSMLTYRTLKRFETENKTARYTAPEIVKIEHSAYVANMNRNAHPEWNENDIYADFLRVLAIHKIDTVSK